MATCDIQTLVNQAACLGCIPVGQLQAIKTGLLCNYPVNPPNPPCANLIPDGAVYTDVYTLNLVVGASYTITFGANETGLYNGATEILNPHTSTPVTFIASGDGIFIIPSTNFSTVTAIVCGPACVNLIPAGATYSGAQYHLGTPTHFPPPGLLSPLTTYQITFGNNEDDLIIPNQSTIFAPGTFQFTTGNITETNGVTLSTAVGGLVTAIICAI
jgi:hypothetical protein